MAEEAAEKPGNAMECPVCSEDFTNPKLLPCNHLVCHKCIVDWLESTNRTGGCPLCRSPILPDDLSGQEDLQTLVDALPTDLAIVSHVEGSNILKGRNVCVQCSTNSAASSFCLQCRMKLCTACVKAHKNIPMLKNHVIEELSDLTPERLATSRSFCKSHDDVLTEMYCLVHRELICMRCAITTHGNCTGVKPIEEAAQARREGMKKEARQLREKERAITVKMTEKNDMLMSMRKTTKDTFDGLYKHLEKKRHEVNTEINKIEDQMALPTLENDRLTVKGNADKVDSLVDSASDHVLLEMSDKLRPRLTGLQQRITGLEGPDDRFEIVFDFQALATLSSFWTITHNPSHRLQSTDLASAATSVGSNPDPTRTIPLATAGSNPAGTPTLATAGWNPNPAGTPTLATAGSNPARTPTLATAGSNPAGTPTLATAGSNPAGTTTLATAGSNPRGTISLAIAGSNPTETKTLATAGSNPRGTIPLATAGSNPTGTKTLATAGSNPTLATAGWNPNPAGTPTSRTAGSNPRGATSRTAGLLGSTRANGGVLGSRVLVRTLNVGDRVRRGRDWSSGNEDGNGLGIVTAVPSKIRDGQRCESEHYVDVRWENGRESCYRMGRYDRYDLELIER